MKKSSEYKELPEEEILAQIDDLLRFDPNDVPVEPVDDLLKRRQINQAVKLAEALDKAKAPIKGGDEYTPWRLRIIFAAAVFLMGLVGAFIWHTTSTQNKTIKTPSLAQAPSVPNVTALLISGEQDTLADRLLSQDNLTPNTDLRTHQGQAVIGVSEKAKIQIGPNGIAQIKQINHKMFELYLNQGNVLVSVEPGAQGPDVMISTKQGTVLVKGTVFSVTAEDDNVAVSVMRGKVQATVQDTRNAQSQKQYLIRAGQSSSLASGTLFQLDKTIEKQALVNAHALDILDTQSQTVLAVRSVPSGATVSLDDKVLGQTPLLTTVRPGYRKLELNTKGHSQVVEQLTLTRNERFSRVFEMTPINGHADNLGDNEPEKTDVPEKADALGKQTTYTSGELLIRASQKRKERKWNTAANLYGRIISNFPRSAEANTARVSQGMIQLRHLKRPKSALKNFNSYLKRSSKGALAQEAAYGKARALKMLGAKKDEIAALRYFIKQFPHSLWIDEVQHRLNELTQ